MLVSNFQIFLLIFSSSPPIFDCLYCLQLKLSWTLSAILMMSKFVVFSLSVLSRFVLLSLDVHSAVSSRGQSLPSPTALWQMLRTSFLQHRFHWENPSSLLPSRIINYPVPLSPYRYHFIIAYMRSNWSPRIFTIISLLLFPSSFFSTF